jgi:hypothetical protein
VAGEPSPYDRRHATFVCLYQWMASRALLPTVILISKGLVKCEVV